MTIQIKTFILWIFIFILMASSIGFLLFIYSAHFKENLDIHNLETRILIPRIMQSVQYTDSYTGRSYSYIVNPSKFTQKNLNFYFTNQSYKNFGFMVALYDLNGSKIAKELYYNKNFYDYTQPLTYSDYYEQDNITKYVFVKKGNQLKNAILKTIFIFKQK